MSEKYSVFNRPPKGPSVADLQRQLDMHHKYQRTFSGAEGEEVLNDILKDCGIMHSSFDPDDAHRTAYNEGCRSVGLRLLTILNLDVQKLKERMENNAPKT